MSISRRLSGAQQLAGSGRTSFPVDKTLPRDAYRMLGYRQCGERAVRVDILERLADLIRPALSWREASPGDKPPGAFDGRGFVVTQAMTSLTGSAGEDFASILRALGYRMERRPPLPPKPVVVETVVADAPRRTYLAETPAEASAETPAEGTAEIVEQPVSGDPAPSAALLPEVTPIAAIEETPAVIEPQPEPAAEAAPEPAARLRQRPKALQSPRAKRPWRWRRLRQRLKWQPQLKLRQRRRHPPSRNWSKSGGPAAAATIAARAMSVSRHVIKVRARKARRLPPRRAKRARARSAKARGGIVIAAGGRDFRKGRERLRRPKPQPLQCPRQPKARPRPRPSSAVTSRAVTAASVSRARAGIAIRIATRRATATSARSSATARALAATSVTERGRDKGRDKRDRESGPALRPLRKLRAAARPRRRSQLAVRQARRAEGSACR